MAVEDLNNNKPIFIKKINGVTDDDIVGINGVTYDSEQGKLYNSVIAYSCIFDHTSVTRLERVYNTAATVDAQIMTFSVLLKKSVNDSLQLIAGGKNDDDNKAFVAFDSANRLWLRHRRAGTWQAEMITTRTFVDCAAWYHIHYIYDSDQVTATDRITLTINGVVYDASDSGLWATYNLPDLGEACRFLEDNEPHWVSGYPDQGSYFEGYMADVYCLEGKSVAATEFGEFNDGIWIPKDYTVGDNGEGDLSYKLDFSNSSHFGEDQSINGNDFTDTNFSTDHQVPDTPENNFCTLDYNNTHATVDGALGDGALVGPYSGTAWTVFAGTFLMRTGKWYWEVDLGSDNLYLSTGIIPNGEESGNFQTAANTPPGTTSIGYGFKTVDATHYGIENNASVTNDDNLDSPTANDILTVAFDADEGKIWFGLYNVGSGHVWGDFGATGVGDPANDTNPAFSGIDAKLYDYLPCIAPYAHITSLCNFGQRAFSGTQPTGFLSLCNANLIEPPFRVPNDNVFNVVLWDGDGGATKAITGVGFQPDIVWIKARTGGSTSHKVFDSVRLIENSIEINNNIAESNQDPAGYLTSFDADGFSLDEGGGAPIDTHETAYTYVGWCFKKDPDYGIDVQTYLGTSIAKNVNHNLGAIPELIMVKARTQSTGRNWAIYHHGGLDKTNPEEDYGRIDIDNAWATLATIWNDTAPTADVFTIGTSDLVNDDTYTYLAYLFRSVDNISKVFSYEGNGSGTGPFIHCGFRPRFLLFKNADGSNSWRIYDTERNPYNGFSLNALYPDLAAIEATADLVSIEILSNGFNIKVSTSFINDNNRTYVGIAFAEQPFKYANAR